MEADFQREYGLNLEYALADMSWRRFLVLLNGLSRDAVFIISNQPTAPAIGDGLRMIEDADEAERALSRVW